MLLHIMQNTLFNCYCTPCLTRQKNRIELSLLLMSPSPKSICVLQLSRALTQIDEFRRNSSKKWDCIFGSLISNTECSIEISQVGQSASSCIVVWIFNQLIGLFAAKKQYIVISFCRFYISLWDANSLSLPGARSCETTAWSSSTFT